MHQTRGDVATEYVSFKQILFGGCALVDEAGSPYQLTGWGLHLIFLSVSHSGAIYLALECSVALTTVLEDEQDR